VRETAREQLSSETDASVASKPTGLPLVVWKRQEPLTEEWYDEAISVTVVEAIHASVGLPEFHTFTQKLCDNGFGRIRKLFLGLATPMMLASRAPEFWSYDHTTGTMTAQEIDTGVLVNISDHDYARSVACRALMTEYIRHAVSLTRARLVTAAAQSDPDILKVRVRWSM
jgi:hypothetical protein